MKLVSACLAGINCRYDGKNKLNHSILKLVQLGKAIPLCPEQLGGLTTPKESSEIVDGTAEDVLEGKAKILTISGKDVTENIVKGAKKALRIAESLRIREAILKMNSPSCADGVLEVLLKKNGIKVYTEENFESK